MTDDIARKASEALRYVLSPFENYSDDVAKGASMKEDIIAMARRAGAHDDGNEVRFVELRYLERFAALVAAAEREETDRLRALCDELLSELYVYRASKYLKDTTAAIRARGQA